MIKSLRYDFYATFAFATLTTICVAIFVAALPGASVLVSAQLNLELVASESHVGEVAAILFRNALTCAIAPALAFLLVPARGQARAWAGSAFLALVLMPQLLIVGAAIGAYGLDLAAFLPHLPLEWAALSLSAAVWISSTRACPSGRDLLSGYALILVVLLAGSLVEVYLTP